MDVIFACAAGRRPACRRDPTRRCKQNRQRLSGCGVKMSSIRGEVPMPNPFAPVAARPCREIRLTRRAVVAFATVLTFVSGTLFSSAAMAAGIDSPDVLALVFALGGCTMLFLLLVWYIAQL